MRNNAAALHDCFAYRFRSAIGNGEPNKVEFVIRAAEAAMKSVEERDFGKAVRGRGGVIADTWNRAGKKIDARWGKLIGTNRR